MHLILILYCHSMKFPQGAQHGWNPYIHATQIENLPTPVFAHRSHGQRVLVVQSAVGHKESGMNQQLNRVTKSVYFNFC